MAEANRHHVVLHYAIRNGTLELRHDVPGAGDLDEAVRASLRAMGQQPRSAQVPDGARLVRVTAWEDDDD